MNTNLHVIKVVLRAIKYVWNITLIETHAAKKSFVVLMFLHYMQIAIWTVE